MPEGFSGIIAQLENQKAAIERALEALQGVDGIASEASPATKNSENARSIAKRPGGLRIVPRKARRNAKAA